KRLGDDFDDKLRGLRCTFSAHNITLFRPNRTTTASDPLSSLLLGGEASPTKTLARISSPLSHGEYPQPRPRPPVEEDEEGDGVYGLEEDDDFEEFRLPMSHRPTENLDTEVLEQASVDTQLTSSNVGSRRWVGRAKGFGKQGFTSSSLSSCLLLLHTVTRCIS
ncbi:Os04g0114801, partial [Oryza sativa Japonica Group]